MRISRLLLTAAAVAGLSGCAMNQSPAPFPDVVYQCEDGRWFRAVMTPTRATIMLPDGRRYQLTGRMSGENAWYTASRVQFSAGRRGAFLRTDRDPPYRDCWLVEG